MSRRLEDDVRVALQQLAGEISADPDTAERALSAGRSRLRQVRLAGAVSALVVVSAVVAGTAWTSNWITQDLPPTVQRPSVPLSPSSPSPSTPTPSRLSRADRVEQTEQWLASLPAAPDTGLYSVHGRLHDGGTIMDLPHGDLDWLVGRVDGGWLVLAHTDGFTGAEDYGARYGILRPDGSFETIAEGTPMGIGISADGSQVVVAAATVEPQQQPSATLRVVDAAAGSTLWAYPLPTASQVFGLVDGTVVYETYWRGTRVWTLTSDGTRAQVFRGSLSDVAPVNRLVAYQRGRCTTVAELPQSLTASPAAPQRQGCAPQARAISPSGRLVLTYGREVVDIKTGERATFAFAGEGVSLAYGAAWAGNDSLLFEVGWPRRAALIRCQVVLGGRGDCQRVAPLTKMEFRDQFHLADAP